MVDIPSPTGSRALLLATLLLALPLAGCASSPDGGGGGDAGYASFDAAIRAPGNIYEPEAHTGGTDVHLKVLAPSDPDNAAEGEADVVILLFDAETNEPHTAAVARMEARMPSMGHGCGCDEQQPKHVEHGVYEGQTKFTMHGNWELRFDVTIPTGEAFTFKVPVRVNQ